MITKGYMTADEVFWSCPKETKVYENMYKLQQADQDRQAWLNGIYVMYSIASCLSKDTKYPEEPLASDSFIDEETKKERKLKEFIQSMQTMADAWKATHGNNEVKGEIE